MDRVMNSTVHPLTRDLPSHYHDHMTLTKTMFVHLLLMHRQFSHNGEKKKTHAHATNSLFKEMWLSGHWQRRYYVKIQTKSHIKQNKYITRFSSLIHKQKVLHSKPFVLH